MTDTDPVDEHPWCQHPHCHDRAHGDPVHTDEDGRPFTVETIGDSIREHGWGGQP